jgi:hypothetical protein
MNDQQPNPATSQQERQQQAPPTGISGEGPGSPSKVADFLKNWSESWVTMQKAMGKRPPLSYWLAYGVGSFFRYLRGASAKAVSGPDYSKPKAGADDPLAWAAQQVTGVTADPFHAEVVAAVKAKPGSSRPTFKSEQTQTSRTTPRASAPVMGR